MNMSDCFWVKVVDVSVELETEQSPEVLMVSLSPYLVLLHMAGMVLVHMADIVLIHMAEMVLVNVA